MYQVINGKFEVRELFNLKQSDHSIIVPGIPDRQVGGNSSSDFRPSLPSVSGSHLPCRMSITLLK